MTTNLHIATPADIALSTNTLVQPFAVADDIRELSLDEVDGVAGGLDPVSMLVGGAVVLVGYGIGWLLFGKAVAPAQPAGGASK